MCTSDPDADAESGWELKLEMKLNSIANASAGVAGTADAAWLGQAIHFQKGDPFLMTDHSQVQRGEVQRGEVWQVAQSHRIKGWAGGIGPHHASAH